MIYTKSKTDLVSIIGDDEQVLQALNNLLKSGPKAGTFTCSDDLLGFDSVYPQALHTGALDDVANATRRAVGGGGDLKWTAR